jgi:hypothetical protein
LVLKLGVTGILPVGAELPFGSSAVKVVHQLG